MIMRRHNRQDRGETRGAGGGQIRLWGRHAMIAALANPHRQLRKLWATREAADALQLPPGLPVSYAGPQDLAAMVVPGAPHQGLVGDFAPLPDRFLDEFLDQPADDRRPIILLDQVTDPQNIGAILRSAAAFDAVAIITQDRHSPPESGVIARAAAGALESVAWVRVVNLARALDEVAEGGYWRVGLAGEATMSVATAIAGIRPALVLGAEGTGMRPNIAEHCDQLARLPISPRMESLNVSNAAAIALYAAAEARAA
jgi:23S rRNA (guanosine2251-2'-O)-methyltransferase